MNETVGIDLKKVGKVLLERAWIIVVCTILVAAIAFVYTSSFATKMYTASVTMYVNNNSEHSANTTVQSSNLAVALQLVKTYVNIIKSDKVLAQVADEAGSLLSPSQIRGMMTAESIEETEIFSVRITSKDPKEAAALANAIAKVAPQAIPAIIKGSSAEVIDEAKVPTSASSPNIKSSTILGALVGFVLATATIVLQLVLDMRVKDESDLESICDIPVLGRIPDMTLLAKAADKKVKR